MAKKKKAPLLIRAWFGLTRNEKWFLFTVLSIALIGSIARYFYLKNQQTRPYYPEGLKSQVLESKYEP